MKKEGYHSMMDDSNLTVNKRIRNAQLAQWNYMLVVGQDEMDLGMVNVRTREGKVIGMKRVDEVIQMFKEDKPPVAEFEKKMYENIWKAEDFPFDQAKFEEVLANEAKKAEEYKKKQAEKAQKAQEEKASKGQKEGKSKKGKKGGKKEQQKQEKKEEKQEKKETKEEKKEEKPEKKEGE